MVIQAVPYVLILGIMYGSTLVVSRFSVGQFHPATYLGLRFTMAGLAHVAIYGLSKSRRISRDRRLWRHAAVLGIMGTAVPMFSIVSSLQYQSSGVTSVLLTTNPALTVLLAHFFLLDEKLTWRKGLGIMLALGGAAFLAASGESGLPDVTQANPLGYGLVLLAMICSSSMTIYTRKFMSDLDSFDVASIRMFVAALVVLPLSILFVGFDLKPVSELGYAGLIYAALVGTFSGMMLAFYIIKRFGATTSAMTSYIIPIAAGIGGALFLGERVTQNMMIGMTFVIFGIALINRGSAPKIRQSADSLLAGD